VHHLDFMPFEAESN